MLLFQNESKYENEFCLQFHFHVNQSHFRTLARFETEAQGNSEMAYYQVLCAKFKPLTTYIGKFSAQNFDEIQFVKVLWNLALPL